MRLKYKFTLDEDYKFLLGNVDIHLIENDFVYFKDGYLVIKKGYSWDGCTPKFKILDLIFGTPDGSTILLSDGKRVPITWQASLIHDSLYQFSDKSKMKRSFVDALFYLYLDLNNFFWTETYFLFVRSFGWYFWNKK